MSQQQDQSVATTSRDLHNKGYNRLSVLQKHIQEHGPSFDELIYVKKSNVYQEATRLQKSPITLSQLRQKVSESSGLLLVKNLYAGIQASEIMISNGVYGPLRSLSKSDNVEQQSIVAGGEACGQILAISDDLSQWCEKDSKFPYRVGNHVLFAEFSHGYVEYHVIHYQKTFPIPESRPEFVSIIVSGTTAYLALKEKGGMTNLSESTDAVPNQPSLNTKNKPRTCLVTGAAGATGTFAVQLAKRMGYHVIGTCGDEQKKQLLLSLHCDRVINYKQENVSLILKREYPSGIDLIYEGVGGDMFKTAFNHLATFGQLISIGSVSEYKSSGSEEEHKVSREDSASVLCNRLLFGSKTISGFFLLNYTGGSSQDKKKFVEAIQKLIQWYYYDKTMKVPVDEYCYSHMNGGVHSVVEAVTHLHSGFNKGKVFVAFRR